ncbi:hypothetical protein CEE45_12235 [Candidatus Heimdallarchaeota archaeon B3_Heim]|nr:MAG: hypothetical protein CEE45_12235 [Candidatus Heimdallarchaeota archaeon B3_Heim]
MKDNYIPVNSDWPSFTTPTRTMNPVIKFLAITLIAIYYFIITDLIRMYSLIFIVLIYYNFKSFPYQVSKPKYRFLIIFSLLIFLVQAFANNQGKLVFYLIPRIIEVGPFIPIHENGLFLGLLLVGRFWGVITISWVFIDSTNPFDFAQSLTQLKVPYRLAYSLSLALRFTPVLNNEIMTIRNAQQTRGLNTNPNSLKGTFNLLKFTLFPIISSTLSRIKDITLSMEGRAFGLYVDRTPLKEIPFRISDMMLYLMLMMVLWLLLII